MKILKKEQWPTRKDIKKYYYKKIKLFKRHLGFLRYWRYKIFKYQNWLQLNRNDILMDPKQARTFIEHNELKHEFEDIIAGVGI